MASVKSTMELERVLGHRFADRALLERALIHRSLGAESDSHDNETLEFLGDAVLDLVISEMIMNARPDLAEGGLTRLRASLVNERHLANVARELELGRFMRLGRGEQRSGGHDKDSILASAYEAVVGAVFSDGGYEIVREVVAPHFSEIISGGKPAQVDHKTELQELAQRLFKTTPSYRVTNITGPDHARSFKVEIVVDGRILGEGEGSSRKGAEQMAAKEAAGHLAAEEEE